MLPELVLAFFLALGIVIGGSLFSAVGAVLSGQLPVTTVLRMGEDLKLWATIAALGGTFPAMRALEGGLFSGQMGVVAQQVIYILTAFTGAHLGTVLVTLMVRNN